MLGQSPLSTTPVASCIFSQAPTLSSEHLIVLGCSCLNLKLIGNRLEKVLLFVCLHEEIQPQQVSPWCRTVQQDVSENQAAKEHQNASLERSTG